MGRRKWLVRICGALALLGMLGASLPFGRALSLPANAGEHLPRIDISGLQPGEFMYVDEGSSHGSLWSRWIWRFMVVRLHDGNFELFVLNAQAEDGKVVMPDGHWWRFAYACEGFGPAERPGPFAEGAQIKCHDDDIPFAEWAELWRWNLQGHHLSRQRSLVPDMERIRFSIEAGGYLVPLKVGRSRLAAVK